MSYFNRIIRPGTRVRIGNDTDRFDAVIDYAKIGRRGVIYGIEYWNGREHKNVLLYEEEFEVPTTARTQIGYRGDS